MPRKYTLADAIVAGIESAMMEVHTTIPGRVVDFDTTKGTATVEAAVALPILTLEGAIVYDPFPTFPDVPVGFPGGGGVVVAWHLQAGDPVALCFSEVPCGQYLSDGNIEQPVEVRRFSLGYPFALPGGFRPDAKALASIPDAGIVIGMDTGEPLITVDGTGIKLGRSASSFVALAPLVQSAIANLATWVKTGVAPSGGGPVTYGAPAPTDSVAATQVKAT